MTYYYDIEKTDIGFLLVVLNEGNLVQIDIAEDKNEFKEILKDFTNLIKDTEKTKFYLSKVKEYYLNQKLDIEPHLIGTDFQKSVWREIQKIPFGKTMTY